MYRTQEIEIGGQVHPPPVEIDTPAHPDPLADTRFRSLLGEAAWDRLPAAIKRRFGKRLSCGSSIVYQGEVTAMKMNVAGRILTVLAKAIGSPLPFDASSVARSAVVIVTEDAASGGQFWIRQYGRASGFPQTVSSSKRFDGPTGLEEYIGYGIGMALRLEATPRALHFLSDGYFLKIGRWRARLPKWLSPGNLVIVHEELGDGRFKFSLNLTHGLFGSMIVQDAIFQDAGIIGG